MDDTGAGRSHDDGEDAAPDAALGGALAREQRHAEQEQEEVGRERQMSGLA
jgi:hypothetical protein